MTATLTPGAIKKFRRTPWRFQQTVERPEASDLHKFVSAIFRPEHHIEAATVTIDEVIFNTERMTALCPAGFKLTHDSSIVVDSVEELQTLLVAAFWDGP